MILVLLLGFSPNRYGQLRTTPYDASVASLFAPHRTALSRETITLPVVVVARCTHLRLGHSHREHQRDLRLDRMECEALVYRGCPAGWISIGSGNHLPADEQALCRCVGAGVFDDHCHCRCLCPALAH